MSAARHAVLAAMKRETLRFQLAIHCPPVPDWFQGECEPEPALPVIPEGLSAIGFDLADQYRRQSDFNLVEAAMVRLVFTDERSRLIEWGQAMDASLALRAAWRAARPRKRLAQWPWAYADMVLEARS